LIGPHHDRLRFNRRDAAAARAGEGDGVNIVIGWPEGIYLGLNLICMAYSGAVSGGRSLVGYGLAWVFLTLPLLYWGGFFS